MTSYTWTTKAAAPVGIANAGVASMGSLLLVAGGNENGSFAFPVATLRQWDSATNTWSTKASMPTARAGGAGAVIGTKFYHFGAVTYEWNQATNTWATKAAPPADPSGSNIQAAVIGTKVYVLRSNSGAFYEYDQATNTWATKAAPPLFAGSAQVLRNLVTVGTKLFGLTTDGKLLCWDQGTNAWSNRTKPVNTAGTLYAAVGTRIVAFGAGNGSGYSYETTTDVWTPITLNPDDTSVAGWVAVMDTNKAVVLSSSVTTTHSTLSVLDANRPPFKPALVLPSANQAIDRALDLAFTIDAHDPDGDDELDTVTFTYRPKDTVPWTDTITQSFSVPVVLTGGTLAAGDWEWTAYVTDIWGESSTPADSGFFTAADAPAAPVVTAPAADDDPVSFTYDLTWTATGQTSYQVITVGDDGSGNPDMTTVYTDSGELSGATTTRTVNTTANGSTEHALVRYRNTPGGLWSPYADRRVAVSYTPAHDPAVTFTPQPVSGSLLLGISNPAPGTDEPDIAYNDVWINDDNGLGWKRKGRNVAPDTDWIYQTPRSDIDYDDPDNPLVQVIAYGVNGVPSTMPPGTPSPNPLYPTDALYPRG